MGGLGILVVMILLSLSSPRRDMAGHHGPMLPAQLVAGRGPTLTCEATEDGAVGDEGRRLGWSGCRQWPGGDVEVQVVYLGGCESASRSRDSGRECCCGGGDDGGEAQGRHISTP